MKTRIYGMLTLLAAASMAFGASDADQLVEQILKVRGEPLRQIEGVSKLYVRDFGALPDDGKNDLPALQEAMKKGAELGGNVELIFEPGRYLADVDLGDYQPKEPAVLRINRLKNIVIDGRGAELLIQRPSIGFCTVSESTNIIVRNFTIDYDPLPFSQGTVVDLDVKLGWVDVETDEGFLPLDDPLFSAYNSWGMLKDPQVPGKLKDGTPNVLFRSSCTAVSHRIFRLQFAPEVSASVRKGDRYAQVARASGAFEYYNSQHVTFENITIHAVAGSLFVGSGTSFLNVLNCRGKLKEGRLLVNGADGVHCQGARVGPWVEGCEFEGLSDDCLNIYSLPNHVVEVLSETRFRMEQMKTLKVGDDLVFFRPQTGEVLAKVDIVSIQNDVVTLSHPVAGLNLAPKGTPFTGRDWKIYDHAYNVSATGNYFVYRNNYMHDGRRFGGFIKASYGLVENNRFERLSDCALTLKNEPGWPEGFWAHNLVIRNNQMLDCAFLNNRISVDVDWQKLQHQSAAVSGHRNLFFEGNRVRARFGPAAQFNGIDGLTLRGNQFESGSMDIPWVTGENTTIRANVNNGDPARIRLENP